MECKVTSAEPVGRDLGLNTLQREELIRDSNLSERKDTAARPQARLGVRKAECQQDSICSTVDSILPVVVVDNMLFKVYLSML